MRKVWAIGSAAVVLALGLSVGVPVTRAAQQQPTHGTGQTPGGIPMPSDAASGVPSATTPDPMKDRMENGRERLFQNDRHKKLVEDSAKLVQLATELKAAVDKTPKDQLSLDIVKRAGEIEKMAHEIKEREKN